MDFGKADAVIAYRITYVARDGRSFVTAADTVEAARDRVAAIAADCGTVTDKRVEHGYEAAFLLRAVTDAVADSQEVF
jgi:hypothetical protein